MDTLAAGGWEAVADLVEIESPTRFALAGRVFDAAAGPADAVMPPLVTRLAAELYRRCFCRSVDTLLSDNPPAPADPHFVGELSAANASRNRVDGGWRLVQELPSDYVCLEKHGVTRIAERAACSPTPGSDPVTVGLPWPRESTTVQPRFYFAFGDAIGDQQDDHDLVKVYWHISARGAPVLMRLLTHRLNRFQIPFRFKCLNAPDAYTRADAAVLFVTRRFYRMTSMVLPEVHAGVRDALNASVPLFSHGIAHGVAVAEEPANGESFGQQRCRLLAEGLWLAHRHDPHRTANRRRTIRTTFAQHGIDPERPHLEPHSDGEYPPLASRPIMAETRMRATKEARPQGNDMFVEIAERIGARLCREAVWADRRCNWVGAGTGPRDALTSSTLQACGPDLSAGTAGIALFLARLFDITAERPFAATAEGALRHALSRVDDVPEPCRRDPLLGLPGIAYAAHEISGIIAVPKYAELARVLLQAIDWPFPPAAPHIVAASTVRDGLDAYLEDTGEKQSRLRAVPASPYGDEDCSVAFGRTGLVDVLMAMGRQRDESRYRAAAETIARTVADRHGADGVWPCATPSGRETPGLLPGLAGIGHVFLMLHDTGRAPVLHVAEA